MGIFEPSDLDYAGKRLPLMATRVIKPPKGKRYSHQPLNHHKKYSIDSSATHGHGHGHGHGHDEQPVPEGPIDESTAIFTKSHAAANFELFYDLWFVANLNVFTTVHEIAALPQLVSYIGFMVLLWTTWLMVTIYDVRFNADCVFERVCKAIHLGVMVGFAMIGTSFNPDHQIKSIFQALTFFLAVSRMTLCLQHSVLAYQIRKFADGIRPMLITAFLNFAAGAIYFGIAFRFDPNKNSRVYVVWYCVGVVEMAAHLGFSQLSRVLTFVGSHFGERLNLLTLIIIGEGCIIVAKNVTYIVKDTYLKGDTQMWTPQLIGIMTSSAALLYIIFQLYFDWMHEEQGAALYENHQIWWASLHLPFHIALVLLLEGASQFVIWHRILEDVDKVIEKFLGSTKALGGNPTTEGVVQVYTKFVNDWLKKYSPAEPVEAYESVNEILADIATLPDSFWTDESVDNNEYEKFVTDVSELIYTMVNSIFNAFGIEAPENKVEGGSVEVVQSESTAQISQRFVLIFIYTFACAGVVIIFLSLMHTMSKRKGWSPFNIFRTAVCIFAGMGLSLTALLALNDGFLDQFMDSAWMLPVITSVYFLILVMTHLPHPPSFGLGKFVAHSKYANIEKQHGSDANGHDYNTKGNGIYQGENVPLQAMTSPDPSGNNHGGHSRSVSAATAYEDFRSPGLMAPSPNHSPENTPRNSSFVDPYNVGSEPTVYDPTSHGYQDNARPQSQLYPTDLYDEHHQPGQTQGVDASTVYDGHDGRRASMPLHPGEHGYSHP